MIIFDHNLCRINALNDAVVPGKDHITRIAGHHRFHSRADERGLRFDQRHCLALHVGSHQGPVGIVVFQERDQCRCNAHNLLGRNVHVLDLVRRDRHKIIRVPRRNRFGNQPAPSIDFRIGLTDYMTFSINGRQGFNVIRHTAVFHFSIRRLDKPKFVHARVRCQRRDQADVRTLGRFNGTDATVV